MRLSDNLRNCYRRILLDSGVCNSIDTLRSLFVGELEPYKNYLPIGNNAADLANKLIAFLQEHTKPGRPVLLLFLKELRHHIPDDDEKKRLDRLYGEIEVACDIDESLSLQKAAHSESEQHELERQEKLRELARMLHKISAMQDKTQRKEILRSLPTKMQGIANDDRASDFKNVFKIVQHCDDFPGGLVKLIDVLSKREDISQQQLSAIEPLLEQLSAIEASPNGYNGKPVTDLQLNKLENILAQQEWPSDILREAYNTAVPEVWTPLDTKNLSLSAILENLAGVQLLPDGDGIPRILVLAQYFADHAQQSGMLEKLNDWINARKQELQFEVDTLQQYARKYANPDNYYLLLAMDRIDETNFAVQAWFFDRNNVRIQNAGIEPSDNIISRDKLQADIEAIIKKCEDYISINLAKENKLFVEFALPDDLLFTLPDNLPHDSIDQWLISVDQWRVRAKNNDKYKVKLGVLHTVVVRSLRRFNIGQMHPALERKWQILREGSSLVSSKRKWVLYCPKGKFKTYESLLVKLTGSGSSTVLVPLAFSPLDHSSCADHIFEAIYDAGVPAMLWPRMLTDYPHTILKFYKKMLSPRTLAILPDIVLELRRKAVEDDEDDEKHHQGHHLILLWDDPRRLPETSQLSSAS